MENEIVGALRRIMRAIDVHSHHLLDAYGLTGPQLTVLREAAKISGAPASALARAVHLSRPTVTGILDRLERRGLIRRDPDPRDRRSFSVWVTAAGSQVLSGAPSLLQDRFRRELASLEDWERTQILATLQRIAAMMDAEAILAEPPREAATLEPEGVPFLDAEPAGEPAPSTERPENGREGGPHG